MASHRSTNPTSSSSSSLRRWLEERTGLDSILREALDEPIPGGARWAYIFGSGLVVLFLSQVLTGVALALYYVPAANDAHVTVAYIVKVVSGGAFLRSLHSYGASAVIVVMVLHILQTFFYGAYKGRRELVWLAGCALLALMLGMAFTGYLLPWDQKAYFATAVGTNVMGEAPGGNLLKQLIRGGNELGTVTLSRFFVLHVFVLPVLIATMMALHVYLFRKAGPAGPIKEDALEPKLATERFYPRQFGRDLVFVLLLLTALAWLAYRYPVPLGPEADPSDTAYLPRPEWYFLPVFQWLKLWPGQSALIGVVVLPAIVTALFVGAPFLDRGLERSPLRRPLGVAAFCVVLGGMVWFGVQSRIEDRRDMAVSSQMARQERAVTAFMKAPFAPQRMGAAANAGPGPKTAEQVFKNIRVLKGTPADQLVLGMHLVEGELGVDCVFCHLDHVGDHFPLDDRPAKQTARQMITMVKEINETSFDGQPVVTCYTCHRGRPKPVNMMPLPLMSDELLEGEPKPALPGADQILAKYVEALGGEAALRRVSSREISGTQDLATGPGGKTPLPSKVVRYQKAPNLVAASYQTANGAMAEGFDGTTAWSQDLKGAVTNSGETDQKRTRRAADFYEALDLKQQYTRMEVQSIAKVGDREAYAVMGFPNGDSPEELYFDTQTGLLLRRVSILPTALGDSPFQIDYDDYRDTGSGVKIPFLVRMTPGTSTSEPQTHSTLRIQKVQDNIQIDSAKLAKPQAKPAGSN